jgi:D-glycero-D-manno-heptose 1,7-bisphosphate phosphatase
MSPRAVFLDRDGVLNAERSYICRPEELELLPGVADALRRLGTAGFLRIVVTNQSAIARGLLDFERLTQIHAKLREGCEGELDAILACPHHPSAGSSPLTRRCICRKPAPGMLVQAQQSFGLSPQECVLVGDTPGDLGAAHAFGCPGIVVLGPKIERPEDWPHEAPRPACFVRELGEAVDWILAERGDR